MQCLAGDAGSDAYSLFDPVPESRLRAFSTFVSRAFDGGERPLPTFD